MKGRKLKTMFPCHRLQQHSSTFILLINAKDDCRVVRVDEHELTDQFDHRV
jgi:hypothetical protein